MNKSNIDWCDYTWNPTSGCSKVSEGCFNCYAERHANRFWGDRDFNDVQLHHDRLKKPFNVKVPKIVFVDSMSDLFHHNVPFDFIQQVHGTMEAASWHEFLVLTKRPERMFEFFDWLWGGRPLPLQNVSWGVSVENQETADERIPLLLKTPATRRFVSYEPAIGAVDFKKWLPGDYQRDKIDRAYWAFTRTAQGVPPSMAVQEAYNIQNGRGVNWLIMGGESGQKARPMHPDWAISALHQCLAADVPFFFKQWGEWLPFSQKGDTVAEHEIKRKYVGDTKISVMKVGKKEAGRLLQGREWLQYPDLSVLANKDYQAKHK